MQDAYRLAFYDAVKDTEAKTGFELPDHLEAYVVMLLAYHIDRPGFLPEDSFAESYLKLSQSKITDAKDLGDTCLFVTGVFPTYGRKHGINRRYYQDIGAVSYEKVAELMNPTLFSQLSTHFVFLSEFIEAVTHPAHLSTYARNNLSR